MIKIESEIHTKTTFGELKKKYDKAKAVGAVSFFINHIEIYVDIATPLVNRYVEINADVDQTVYVPKTNIFDER